MEMATLVPDPPSTNDRRLDTDAKVRVQLHLAEEDESLGITGEQVAPDMFEITWSADGRRHIGIPGSRVVRAYPIEDTNHPHLLAEFAGYLIVRRIGKRLIERKDEQLPWDERGGLRWYYYGEIVRDDDGSLAIGALTIRPWPDGLGARFRGITRELLRVISPTAIIQQVAQLHVVRPAPELADPGHTAIRWEPVIEGTARRGRRPSVPEHELKRYARRYLALVNEGIGRGIHHRLADEFHITQAQSVEWTRRAKRHGFLNKGGTQGQAGATAGPRLTAL
jgi:hypothetical protein